MSLPSGGLHWGLLILVCLYGVISGASLTSIQNGPWERADHISVTNNVGYKNITVAFPPEIKYDRTIIDRAKLLFEEASKSLHTATGGLVSFAEITFLIPNNWVINGELTPIESATKQTYETATFRIVSTDQEFQAASAQPEPITVQHAGCGRSGKYIIIPKLYFTNMPTTIEAREKYARRLSREWARYRYGVFDERGYEGHPLYPLFYSTPGEVNTTILLNSCSNGQLHVREINFAGKECPVSVNETTGLPIEDPCYLEPLFDNQNEEIISSLMFSPDLLKGTRFCGTDPTIHHNKTSPNMQNTLCQGKSVMEIIRNNKDFDPSPSPSEDPVKTTFRYIQEPPFQLAVAVDVGDHMRGAVDTIKPILQRFFDQDIPLKTKVFLVSYGSKDILSVVSEEISNGGSSSTLANKIYTVTSDQSDSCLSCALETLKESEKHPLTVMALTNAKMNDSMQERLESVLKANEQIKLHLIIYPSGAQLKSTLREAILFNGGNIINVKNSQPVLLLTSLQAAFQNVLGKHVLRKEITTAIFPGDKKDVEDTMPFSLDQTEHVEKLKICLYQSKSSPIAIPKETLNLTLGDSHFGYMSNSILFESDNNGDICQWFCLTCSKNKTTLKSEGSLNFTIENDTDEVVVKAWITLVPESSTNQHFIAERINLNAWVEWHDEKTEDAIIIYAELKQGHRPIKGAEVKATVSHPGDDQLRNGETSEVDLYDNGNGDPDIMQGDGIYSRYFTNFKKIGGYVVSVLANGQQGQVQVLESFPIQDFSRNGVKWKTIDGFRRSSPVAGTFQVSKEPQSEDKIPPNRILDLRVQRAIDRSVDLKWTAPGNNFDDDILATEYTIKYFDSMDEALGRFDDTGNVVSIWEMPGQPLKPAKYGIEQEVTVILPQTAHGGYLYFAMKTSDDSNNTSPVSNAVAVYLTKLSDMVSSTSTPNDTSGLPDSYTGSGGLTKTEIGLIVGCVLVGVLLIVVIIGVIIYVRRKKKKKAEEPETFVSIRNRNNAPAFTSNNNGTTRPPLATNGNGPSIVPVDPVNPARFSVSSGGPLQSWPAETLLNHFEKVQEAKQRSQPRPILNVGDLLESLSESNSSVVSAPVQQNGIYASDRHENGFTPHRPAPQRPSSQLSSHSKQVTQV